MVVYEVERLSPMLVSDTESNPYFNELCEAAQQIAALKAQISKLEKFVDSVLAQHLAGQQPDCAPIPHSAQNPDVDDIEHDHSERSTAPDSKAEPQLETDLDIATCPAFDIDEDIDDDDVVYDETSVIDDEPVIENTDLEACKDAPTPITGSLPTAVRSLICRPSKEALTSQDDLTLIRGIDCALALQLAAQDLSRFDDIAELNAGKIQELVVHVHPAHRIHKDGWIEQAAILADGQLTAYAREILEARKAGDADAGETPQACTDDPAEDALISVLDDDGGDEKIDINALDLIELPRVMHIERPAFEYGHLDANAKPFYPTAEELAALQTQALAQATHHSTRDYGNLRAIAASLVATAAIFSASSTVGLVDFSVDFAGLVQADMCQLSGLSMFPDVCKQLLGSVL